eukprot:Nk52_evm53s62 gene=Nk52_evmTU53s62
MDLSERGNLGGDNSSESQGPPINFIAPEISIDHHEGEDGAEELAHASRSVSVDISVQEDIELPVSEKEKEKEKDVATDEKDQSFSDGPLAGSIRSIVSTGRSSAPRESSFVSGLRSKRKSLWNMFSGNRRSTVDTTVSSDTNTDSNAHEAMRESFAGRLSLAKIETKEKEEDPFVQVEEEEAHIPFQKTSQICQMIMDLRIVNIIMIIATVWVLFIDDFRLWLLPKSVDWGFGLITFIFFILFVLEWFLLLIAQRRRYLFQLFCWLDMLAIISLIPDVAGFFGDDSITNSLSSFSVARAGRAARASTRIGRLIRVIRLLMIMRAGNAHPEEEDEVDADDDDILQPTRVGTRLKALTTNKVVIGVLLMLLTFNLLTLEDATGIKAFENGLNHLDGLTNFTATELQSDIALYGQMFPDLVYLKTQTVVNYYRGFSSQSEIDDELRDVELEKYSTGNSESWRDVKETSQEEALFSILLTIFIIILLTVGNLMFERDATNLVIKPIEKMTKTISNLASDPLMASGGSSTTDRYETGILLVMINKIGFLLKIAFGVAGAKIISENISHDGVLHPMVPGNTCSAIFGFCDIRNFTDITEILKEDVMLYVNRVASIVHAAVDKHDGAPNKNIGDAFLLVWKPADVDKEPEDEVRISQKLMHSMSKSKGSLAVDSAVSMIKRANGEEDESEMDEAQRKSSKAAREEAKSLVNNRLGELAVSAVVSFLEGGEGLEDDEFLNSYESTLGQGIPNYKLGLGFGFHVGWAIEGPIGSNYKVDASYLSPHVNISARLESATKQYGVDNLFSGQFFYLLPQNYRQYFIKIDYVTVKGSQQPIMLFTLNPKLKVPGRRFFTLDILTNENEEPAYYKQKYESGISAYVTGKWSTARDILKLFSGSDDPLHKAASVLISYMENLNYKAPKQWKGYRALTDK